MERRSLLAAALATLAEAMPVAIPQADCTKPPGYDSQGRALCHIYRESTDPRTGRRKYLEITIADLKVGDKIVCIGINNDSLFMAHAATIAHLCPAEEWNGHTGGYIAEGPHTNLLE